MLLVKETSQLTGARIEDSIRDVISQHVNELSVRDNGREHQISLVERRCIAFMTHS